MSAPTIINGRSVTPNSNLSASSYPNYIILRTKGVPLNKSQKSILHRLGIIIQEFIGDDINQVYLCNSERGFLDQVKNLDLVDYIDAYATKITVPDTLQADATVDVVVLLHHDVTGPSDNFLREIADAAGVAPAAIVVEDGGVQIPVVVVDRLEKIAALDEVRVVHAATEPALFDGVARGVSTCWQCGNVPRYRL